MKKNNNKSRKAKFTRSNDSRSSKDKTQNKNGNEKFNRNEESNSSSNYRLSSLNDVSWYTKSPELTASTASIPYPYRPGMKVPFGNQVNEGINNTFDLPGVVGIRWIPSFGYSQLPSDPASIVAREIYGRVRKSFSSALSVQAPDLLIYLGALDSVFAYISTLKRVYRTLTAFSPDNYMLPNGLLKAYGFKDEEIVELLNNRTRLFSVINELIHMSRKFTCPSGMDIMNRHYWLGDNVYTDAPYINAQMYVFTPQNLYKFELAKDSREVMVGTLQNAPLPWVGPTAVADIVGSIFSYGRGLLDALSEWEDAYTINGYLMRAFEGEQNFAVDLLEENETLSPVYVPEVLSQIKNLRTLPEVATLVDTTVSQDVLTNSVICNPRFDVPRDYAEGIPGTRWYWMYYDLEPIISVDSPTPTVGDTLIATRLHWSKRSITEGLNVGHARFNLYTGTELITNLYLIYQEEGNPYARPIFTEVSDTLTGDQDDDFTVNIARLTQFGEHPILWIAFRRPGVDAVRIPLGDLHNVTNIEDTQLGLIHRVCIYSELNAFSF